jgi:tight adherence protein B
MTALAALAGFLIVGGFWVAVTSWRPVPIVPVQHRQKLPVDPLRRSRILAAVGLAAVVLLVTRWPVAALAGAAVGWAVAGVQGRKQRLSVERRTEAIALWAEMLRDAIGTARGVEGVLVATAATSPLPIRAELETMARRIQHEPLAEVLDGLAEDLDHPLGDLVVTALRLTSTAGGRHVREVLASVAAAAYAEAESHRRVEVARERPRTAMKYTAIVIAGFVGVLVVFSHRYLSPYDSAAGQLVLLFVGAYWAAGFWWMQRMGRAEPVDRFLAKTDDFTNPDCDDRAASGGRHDRGVTA